MALMTVWNLKTTINSKICITTYAFVLDPLEPFSANFTKCSSTLKQFVGNLPTNCLSVFDHFVGLALKGLSKTLLVWQICLASSFNCNILLKYLSFRNITSFIDDFIYLKYLIWFYESKYYPPPSLWIAYSLGKSNTTLKRKWYLE